MIHCRKTKALSLFLLILLLFVPLAGAEQDAANIKTADYYRAPESAADENDLFSVLSRNAELYNEHFDKVPSLVRRFVGSKEIKGEIELENGEMLYVTLLTQGGRIGDFYRYETSTDPNSKFGPTITIKTDEQTVRTILDSKTPLKEAIKSMDAGTLNVEAKGMMNKATLFALKKSYRFT
ncbi:MAG: hypothetical protein ACPK85_10540 [Methanosarcina sp.]